MIKFKKIKLCKEIMNKILTAINIDPNFIDETFYPECASRKEHIGNMTDVLFRYFNEFIQGNINTYFLESNELINFIMDSVSKNDIKYLFDKYLNDDSVSFNKFIDIEGILCMPMGCTYSNLYFTVFPIVNEKDKLCSFTILICTDRDIIISHLSINMLQSKKISWEEKLILGFLLYKEVFPEAVKDGFVFDTPQRLLPKGKHISITTHPKMIESGQGNSPTPHLRRGNFAYLSSSYYKKKQGHVIWRPATFIKGKAKSVINV